MKVGPPFIIAEIMRAQADDRPLDLAGRDPADCAIAIQQLISNLQLPAAAFGADALARAFPNMPYARNIAEVLAHLPRAAPDLPLADDPAKPVQIVARPGARTVIFVFGCPNGRLNMSFGMAHLWLCHLPASLVYLRDRNKTLHLRGVESLSDDRMKAAGRLRELARDLGADRLVCIGHSLGGYSALVYGAELKADLVVPFSGITDFAKPLVDNVPFTTFPDPSVFRHAPDLHRLYRDRTAPRATLIFGDKNWTDRIHAEHLSDRPTVSLRPIKGYRAHDTVMELARRDELVPLLASLIA
jgi:pimeloyl-ACP methyl ester carboxylesterase